MLETEGTVAVVIKMKTRTRKADVGRKHCDSKEQCVKEDRKNSRYIQRGDL